MDAFLLERIATGTISADMSGRGMKDRELLYKIGVE